MGGAVLCNKGGRTSMLESVLQERDLDICPYHQQTLYCGAPQRADRQGIFESIKEAARKTVDTICIHLDLLETGQKLQDSQTLQRRRCWEKLAPA